MNAVEPIADVVTAAATARTLEPETGVDASGHTNEQTCLNCATPLVGSYCHVCGQHGHVHRSLGAFGHDLLHGVFHFEGKVWRTLPLLAWKPGALTRRYIDGQRATFVGPLPLFLFCVFLMFAVAGWVGSVGMPSTTKIQTGISEEVKQEEAKLASMKAELAKTPAKSVRANYLRGQIDQMENDLSLMRTISGKGVLEGSAIRISDDVPDFLREPIQNASSNPKLLLYKLKNNAYKYSWALIPLSVPILWLLFPFSRRFRLYDHTVFVTYSLCFMSVLVVAGMLWRATGMTGSALLLLVPPFHMYRQLRGTYGVSRLGGLVRTAVLTFASVIILSLFAIALLALGALD